MDSMSSIDIIVIGASSGGVEALKTLVHSLPPDLSAALFVILHVGAHPSILPDILKEVGTLPVGHVAEKARIENGNIYMAPPDHHLILSPGHVHVTRCSRGRRRDDARERVTAQRADTQETRQAYEHESQRKERQAALIREILTEPDAAFSAQCRKRSKSASCNCAYNDRSLAQTGSE